MNIPMNGKNLMKQLSEKEEYYSNLNIDGTVLQVHIRCMQKVCKEFTKCL